MRERKALLREAAEQAGRQDVERVHLRKTRVRAGVVRLDEHAALDDDFLEAPVEILIARIAAELGLTPAALEPGHPPPAGLNGTAFLPDSS